LVYVYIHRKSDTFLWSWFTVYTDRIHAEDFARRGLEQTIETAAYAAF